MSAVNGGEESNAALSKRRKVDPDGFKAASLAVLGKTTPPFTNPAHTRSVCNGEIDELILKIVVPFF